MSANTLLFEIGVEELPSVYLLEMESALETAVRAAFDRHRVALEGVRVLYTARRLTAVVSGLADAQPPAVEELKGPPRQVAFGPGGEPLKPAEAFAQKCGVPLARIKTREFGGKEYLFFTRRLKGLKTRALLPDICGEIIVSLRFPKQMRWNDYTVSFARPVRWIVALWNGSPVKCSFGPVQSGPFTWGHRVLGAVRKSRLKRADAQEYIETLRGMHVIADPRERQQRIREGVEKVRAQFASGAVVRPVDEDLVKLTANLVEWPTVVCGRFDEAFLELPADVPVTVMKKHQRYFAVYAGEGKLAPRFVAVSNMEPADPALIVHGNERVLRARLTDAVFFWKTDIATPLRDRVEKLKGMIFHEKLGSYADKVARVKTLLARIADPRAGLIQPEVTPGQLALLNEAADLYKCDLLTDMVRELPELQGVMGGHYAARQGHAPEVCEAIRNQYFPREAADDSYKTFDLVSSLLGLADKIDTIAGCFSIGLLPTGSQDPYGLRRQANGVVKIALQMGKLTDGAGKVSGAYELDLRPLVLNAFEAFPGARDPQQGTRRREALLEFFRERILAVLEGREYFEQLAREFEKIGRPLPVDEAGLKPVIAAVAAVQPFNLPDLHHRLVDLLILLDGDRAAFQKACKVMERARNILKGARVAPPEQPDAQRCAEPAEKELFRVLEALLPQVGGLLNEKNYLKGVQQAGLALFDPLNRFFDDVLVNCPDEALRLNRLALMKQVFDLLGRQVGDLSVLAEKGQS